MFHGDIKIQLPIAIKLVLNTSSKEFGCITARFGVSVIIADSEKFIGYLTVAPKLIFNNNTSCFFAELCDEDGNLGNTSALAAADISEAVIAMLSFKLND